jgi:hypothetical protein
METNPGSYLMASRAACRKKSGRSLPNAPMSCGLRKMLVATWRDGMPRFGTRPLRPRTTYSSSPVCQKAGQNCPENGLAPGF